MTTVLSTENERQGWEWNGRGDKWTECVLSIILRKALFKYLLYVYMCVSV